MTNGKIGKESVQDIFELSATQKGMLFHYLEDVHSNLYNVQLVFDIAGDLDLERLREAIEMTQLRNEVLRSVFRWEEVNKPLQIILKTSGFDLRVKPFSEPALEEDLQERFDITQLPLRFTVFERTAQSYVLAITYHHLLLDGWSNALLLKEIFHYYQQLGSGNRRWDIPSKPFYSEVRKSIEAGYSSASVHEFWGNYLEGYPIVSLFPERAAWRRGKKSSRKIKVAAPIEKLDGYSRRYKVTKASVIYAAYGILLQKYCNTSDVVFGTTVANRNAGIAGIENVMGNFIDTLPVRLSAQGVLAEIVTGVHAGLLERHDHSAVSYPAIKRMLNLKPSEDLFDSVLVIENYPIDKDTLNAGAGLSISMRSFYESIDIPLLVTVFVADELAIEFSFDESKVDAAFLSAFSGHFLNIIEAILTRPGSRAEDLCMLGVEEKDRLVYGFNDTRVAAPGDETIITLFEEQVKKAPEKLALVDRHHALTYRELNSKSNDLAGRLLRLGARKGDIIGVMMPRRQEMLIGILSVLKAGCAYLPIDPDYPVSRIDYMLKDSELAILLTMESLKDTCAQLSHDILIHAVAAEDLDGIGSPDPGVAFSPTDLAYLIYTSGTTGNPKGIMIEHKNVVNYVKGVSARVEIGLYHSVLCLTTVCFDIFVTETIVPLLNGLKVVLATSADQKDAYALGELIVQHDVDLMQITPSHLNLLLNGDREDLLKCLRAILIGGEAWPYELLLKLNARFTGKVYNMYGPTETTVWSAIQDMTGRTSIDIGKPIRNTSLYVLDAHRKLLPIGVTGELFIGGDGLARGYWKNELLTAEKFIADPFVAGQRIYRTGDLAFRQPDGSIKLLGRLDNQVKVRGFRVELGDIEAHLASHRSVEETAVVVHEMGVDRSVVAYYTADRDIRPDEFKGHLTGKLPDYMIPSYFVRLQRLPLTPNGKLDRKALPKPEINSHTDTKGPSNETEQKLIALWSELLGHPNIGVDMNFFDIGGDSLKLIAASNRIRKVFARNLTITDLFEYPTITKLAGFLTRSDEPKKAVREEERGDASNNDIAIIGLACRFPGASTIEEFWELLRQGREGITRTGSPDVPAFVNAKGFLKEYDHFDALFFNYTPSEAEAMDPQMRVFHESVYEALEHAGYAPARYEGRIGLYAGATINPFYHIRVSENPSEDWAEKWDEITYTDKDFLANRVSYKLNLKGPSLNISTACSTSLVAVDKACGELLTGKCEIAVAGGVSITMYDNKGYFYHKDMILSADGKCRAFDEQSSGTVGGNGIGVIVLKKMDRALRDGDFIHAVIKGSATNNDGSDKVGFTAPSINGQSEVIRMALENAGIQAESISCVETHGTGTALGDPIEIAALTKAFNSGKRQFCAIGSVKTNIGHLDAAAGIAGLIKMVLALKHRQIPPSLHFIKPNPNIDFDNSPFFVNAALRDWPNGASRRRAGVSSFGIGGTNAHIILEEAPVAESSSEARKFQLLTVSAKSENALQRNLQQLIDSLRNDPELSLPDVAYTLNLGREAFPYRKAIVCGEKAEAIQLLEAEAAKSGRSKPLAAGGREIVFMFPGLGSQYKDMLAGIYEAEPYFRSVVDEGLGIVKSVSGIDLKEVTDIDQIQYAHPLLFIMEYALARLMISWGILPDLMIGHSVGEYVAACISEVFSLEDALRLVTIRSQLIQHSRGGKMLAVSIPEQDLLPLLAERERISLAAVNSSELCVVSGEDTAIIAFQQVVEKKGYSSQLIRTSHASHSYMMADIMEDFEKEVRRVTIRRPKIPFVSNLTGKIATFEEISDPHYWSRHLRDTVRFAEGTALLSKTGNRLFIETGPGNTLGTFVRSNGAFQRTNKVIYPVRHEEKTADDWQYLLLGLGKLWLNGVAPHWMAFYKYETRKRVPLPTYSFDRIQYPTRGDLLQSDPPALRIRSGFISDWFYTPAWEIVRAVAPAHPGGDVRHILFTDVYGISAGLQKRLAANGEKVTEVVRGGSFRQNDACSFEVDADAEADYIQLFKAIEDTSVCRILFTWGVEVEAGHELTVESSRTTFGKYFYRLLKIARALAETGRRAIELIAITNQASYVLTGDAIAPGKESIAAALKVIRKEYENISCRTIDIVLTGNADDALIDDLFLETRSGHSALSVAYRYQTRFVESYKPLALPANSSGNIPWVAGGVYLITGGAGGIGMFLAKRMVKEISDVRLILLGRRQLPDETLREIATWGGQADYYSVDLEDATALEGVIARAQAKVGKIRGVIHAAGVADYAGIIHTRTETENEKVFSAKIYGTIALNDVLRTNRLDFFVLFSSISAALPLEGQVGYVAANMFLNAFARYNVQYNNVNSISIGWNAWREVGISFRAAKEGKVDAISEMNSIAPDEGYQILLHAIGNGLPESIISKFDLQEITDKRESDTASTGGAGVLYSELSAIEDKMAEIWKKLLGTEDIQPTDDFFEVGGNSLKALTVIGRLRKVFHVELSIKEFFNNSTLTGLSKYIFSIHEEPDGRTERGGIRKAEQKTAYMLSSGQKRLYFLYTFDKSSVAYNVPVVYTLKGELDQARLDNTFAKLIARHESLRTSIQYIDGVLVQKIAQEVDFEMDLIDSEADISVAAVLQSFIKPFVLSKAPLIRAGLIRRSAQEHLLVIDLHHIIADGVSEGVLMKDFMALYNNNALPALRLQYKDYAEWQQSGSQQKRLADQQAFWLNEFSEEFTMADLPTDLPRPEIMDFKGHRVDFELSAASVARLKAMAGEEGVTLFMVLLATLNILLARLMNQEDIVIGTSVANRGQSEFEEIIGMFVNTLALRNFPRGGMRFKDFLAAVKSKTLACFDNQSFPYEVLIDKLGMERDTSRNALFNVVFAYYNAEPVDLSIPGLELEQCRFPDKTSKFDLTLSVKESGEHLLLNFVYATSLFRKETIDRFIAYFNRIVSAVCADVDIRIGEIDILEEKEKDLLLREFNDTRVDVPGDKTVMELFERQVERSPRLAALVYEEVGLSYEELNARANRLAGLLRERYGVGRGQLVCLCLERSEQMVIAILGVLKAGAAYVPMDPGYPDDRVEYIVADTGARLVLANEGQADRLERMLAGRGAEIVAIDGAAVELQTGNYEDMNAAPACGPNDLAYVIYTSGTTGRPKGVMVEHRGIVNLALTKGLQYAQATGEDAGRQHRYLGYSNYVFDAHVWELYTTLINGHCLHLVDKELRTDISRLQAYVRKNAITVAVLPPALLDMEHILELRLLIVAGDTTASRIMERYAEQRIPVINAYGPTETTVCAAFHRYKPGDSSRNIGRPMPNMSLYVLDGERRLLPPGVTGELYIGGAGLARGYWNNVELTAQRFVDNPFADDTQRAMGCTRLYKTGDLVRWLPDGTLEYIGRSDFQVKIRGYRIELGEIESGLSAFPGVRQAVVTVNIRESGDKYLIGYYVADQAFPVAELRDHLHQRLPDYMIPSFFVRLAELPLTVNGKLDRKALPEYKMESNGRESAPANAIEVSLVNIWADILKIEPGMVSTQKSFFELGGDSIKIVRLNAVINERFDCAISIPDLFRYSSITSLAGRIGNAASIADNVLDEAAEEAAEMKSAIGSLFND